MPMIFLAALLSIPLIDSEYPFDISPDGRRLVSVATPNGRWKGDTHAI